MTSKQSPHCSKLKVSESCLLVWRCSLPPLSQILLTVSTPIPADSRTRIIRDWVKVFLFSRGTKDQKYLSMYIGELWWGKKTCIALLDTGDQGIILPSLIGVMGHPHSADQFQSGSTMEKGIQHNIVLRVPWANSTYCICCFYLCM